MIVVRLPAMLRRPGMPADVNVAAPVATIAGLVQELDRRYPGLAAELDDSIINFAVNDALILERARQHPLRAGDVVEIIPMISGGARSESTMKGLKIMKTCGGLAARVR